MPMTMTSPVTGGGFGTVPPPGGPPGSFIPNYPQSPLLQEIAQAALGIGQSVYGWGQGVYNQVGNVTAGNIAQFLDTAQQAGGLASTAAQTFQNVADPAYKQLAAEAEQYASTPFIQQQMGQAEAQAAQGAQASRQNLIQQMQSYGINPSSGSYQGLEEAALTGAGASEAAAGTEAALATKAQGQQLLQGAVQAGEQYPGFAVNALNTGVQALTGAENSELGAANTGVNLQDAAVPYLQAAMALKYPPLGTTPVTGTGNFQAGGKAPPDSSSKGGLQSTNYPVDPYTSNTLSPGSRAMGPDASLSSKGASTSSLPGAKISAAPQTPGAGDVSGQGQDTGNPSDMAWQGMEGGQSYNESGNTPGMEFQGPPSSTDYGIGGGLSYNDSGNTPGMEWSGVPTDMSQPAAGLDQASQQAVQTDFGSAMQTPGYGAGPDTSQMGGASDPTQSYSGSGTDSSYSSYGGTSTGGSYASGGDVRPDIGTHTLSGGPLDRRGGGAVPTSASPSHGKAVDDVNARLTAHEFVIPKDVTKWHGEKFFHDLIAKSRAARAKASAMAGPQVPQHHPGMLGQRPGMNMR